MKDCCELSYNKIYTKATLCCNISDVAEIYNADEFGEWLTNAFKNSRFKSWQEVADAIKPVRGATRSTLSRYAGAKPQTLTGKPSRPETELVIKLANVFNADVDQVLKLAGHASTNGASLPSQLHVNDFDGFDDDDLKDISEYIKFKKAQKKAAK